MSVKNWGNRRNKTWIVPKRGVWGDLSAELVKVSYSSVLHSVNNTVFYYHLVVKISSLLPNNFLTKAWTVWAILRYKYSFAKHFSSEFQAKDRTRFSRLIGSKIPKFSMVIAIMQLLIMISKLKLSRKCMCYLTPITTTLWYSSRTEVISL